MKKIILMLMLSLAVASCAAKGKSGDGTKKEDAKKEAKAQSSDEEYLDELDAFHDSEEASSEPEDDSEIAYIDDSDAAVSKDNYASNEISDFSPANMQNVQNSFSYSYIAAMNDFYIAYSRLVKIIAPIKEEQDKILTLIAKNKSNNTTTKMTENKKNTIKMAESVEKLLEKNEKIQKAKVERINREVIPLIDSANMKMMPIYLNIALVATNLSLNALQNPFSLISNAGQFVILGYLSKTVDDFRKSNKKINALLKRYLEEYNMDTSKIDHAEKSMGDLGAE